MDAARNLKVNLKLDGQTCIACKTALKLADDASICTACEANHHARCWNSYGGCATKGCVNAPLRRMDAPVYAPAPAPGYAAPGYAAPGYAAPGYAAPPPLPFGLVHCRSCRYPIREFDPICPYCRNITSPDGVYRGPTGNAPGAVGSLVLGIIGVIFLGFIVGPIAMSQSSKAKREIGLNPMLTGGGMATAGFVLGIIGTALWGLILLGSLGDN